eukprot:Skav210671  [mRNA]  locus=scaffold5572:1572:2329:- [translate_table: standard]
MREEVERSGEKWREGARAWEKNEMQRVHAEDHRWDLKLPLTAEVRSAVELLAIWQHNGSSPWVASLKTSSQEMPSWQSWRASSVIQAGAGAPWAAHRDAFPSQVRSSSPCMRILSE